MVRALGHKNKVADMLGISLSYVYALENGMIPGKHLYQVICNKSEVMEIRRMGGSD